MSSGATGRTAAACGQGTTEGRHTFNTTIYAGDKRGGTMTGQRSEGMKGDGGTAMKSGIERRTKGRRVTVTSSLKE